MSERRPPRPAGWLLELLLPPGERDEVLGDLEEAYHARSPGLTTDTWYWGQALVMGVVLAGRRIRRGAERVSGSNTDERADGGSIRTDGRGWTMGRWIEWNVGILRELATTVRGLIRRPAYAAMAVATIVLGVGSVTAAYGLLHEVVLRPLPFDDVDRLVAVRTTYDTDILGVTQPEYLALARESRTLDPIVGLVEPNLDPEWTWTDGLGRRRPLRAVRVTDGFFALLGTIAELGTASPAVGVGERRVVVSRAFWQRELGGAPSAVGSSLGINGEPYVVAGVLPTTFEFPLGPESTDVWILFTPEPVEVYAGMPLLMRVLGRLAPGVDRESASGEVSRIVEEHRSGLGDTPGRIVVRGLEEDLVGSARRPLVFLSLAGLLVLLVSAINLSMLIAARNTERREELAVRQALGASRGRLLRHLLAEAAVLALVAAGIAVVFAGGLLERVFATRAGGMARMTDAAIGPEIVLVAVIAALVPALAAASLPALRVATGIRSLGSRGSSTDRRRRTYAWMLSAVETGVVFALLVVAALVVRSLDEVTAVDPGFETASAVALTVFLPPDDDLAGASDLVLRMEEALHRVPGVRAAGSITNLPLSPESWSGSLVIDGRDDVGVDGDVVVDWEIASPGYFDAIGIPLVEGRGFDDGDRAGADRVVIVNEALAHRWWPDGGAIGSRLSGGGPLRTVVGVVGDVKQQGLERATRGFMYLPVPQMGAGSRQEFVARVEGDVSAAVPAIRSALLEVEPDLAIDPVRTLDVLVEQSSGAFRLRAILIGSFAAMALLLGMAGIYGVTAHGVRQRRRDIGIHMAMGADSGRVMAGVVTEALTPVACGLAAGLVMIVVGAPAIRGFLFGVAPTDLGALAGIAALLLASGVGAVLPSAIRARRVDPAGMLRGE